MVGGVDGTVAALWRSLVCHRHGKAVVPDKRQFKVTIIHGGLSVSTCIILAVAAQEAIDHAWTVYEAVNGPVNTFDTTYTTKVDPVHADRS
jgi:hypothetical protein